VKLVLTCEHASNALPSTYKTHFKDYKHRLQTHEGYDIGAFEVFKTLEHFAHFSYYYPWSRLLIEVNRSLKHPYLFSSISKPFDDNERELLVTEFYKPYRYQIQKEIEKLIGRGELVLHLSVHSFTPILNGNERSAEIGILYNPQRSAEKEFSVKLQKELKQQFPQYKIRKNYPYLGLADGFTTSLRKQFKKNYLGIELEINQKLLKKGDDIIHLSEKLCNGLKNCLAKAS
jgi:predicted N-formylglutamate amidohydrolase